MNKEQSYYGLDFLRAFAISIVFLFHYFILSDGQPEWLPFVAKFGWTGVDLFFVLSGFLISSTLFIQIKQGKNISFKQFFQNRFFRIVPAYLVTVAVYFLVPLFREKEALPPLWKLLTFTQNLGLNLKDTGTFSHAWSLCVEAYFYLLLPLILILLQSTKHIRKSYWLIILLFILSFVFRYYSYQYLYFPKAEQSDSWMYWYQYIYYPTYNRFDGLLVGISIACVYHFLPEVWAKLSMYSHYLIGVSFAILVVAGFLCYEQDTLNASLFGFWVVSVGYGFLVMAAISKTCFLYKWNSKIINFIATLSYSIYLTHKGVIHLTQYLFANLKLNNNLLLLISIATSIAIAYLLHITIEKPFMKIGKFFVYKKE